MFSRFGSKERVSDLIKVIFVECREWKLGWNGLESEGKVRR